MTVRYKKASPLVERLLAREREEGFARLRAADDARRSGIASLAPVPLADPNLLLDMRFAQHEKVMTQAVLDRWTTVFRNQIAVASPTIAAKSQRTLTLPGKLAGLSVMQAPVERAIEMLGIRQPVAIRWVDKLPDRLSGRCDFREGVHEIDVVSSLAVPPQEASEWLAHELVHAAQREASGAGFDEAYEAEEARAGYRESRYEVEARTLAVPLARTLSLVQIIRRAPQ